MDVRKITAIVRDSALEELERALCRIGVGGITTTLVKGYGEFANFFSRDHKVSHVCVEIFTDRDHAEEIVETVMAVCHTGCEGDGIVVMIPVEKVWRIRTRNEATLKNLCAIGDSSTDVHA